MNFRGAATCCLVLLGLMAFGVQAGAPRMVSDSAGRTVEAPERVERVYAAGPPAMELVNVLKPEVLTGWPRAPGTLSAKAARDPSRYSL